MFPHNRQQYRSRPQVSPLEDRTLPSFGPIGPEFQVSNQPGSAGQGNPSIAVNATGDCVVTWVSSSPASGLDVYAQRYNTTGQALGAAIAVSTAPGSQYISTNGAVAIDPDGDFVVTWGSPNQDGDSYGVYARRYQADGTPQGSEFRVNVLTTGYQSFAVVGMDAAGGFVVAWASAGALAQNDAGAGIFARRYDSVGTALSGEIHVNTGTTGHQVAPNLAMNAAGNFVLAWQSQQLVGSVYDIYARRYDAAATPQGDEFLVNSYTTDAQRFQAIGINAAGDFVVAWQSQNQDGNIGGIYAQRYSAAGAIDGSEFRVNSYTTNIQGAPTMAMNDDGNFVIAWHSGAPFGSTQDGSGYGVYAQRYRSTGVPAGSEFRVNSSTFSHQGVPSVGMDTDGDFNVAWMSYQTSAPSIFARRYHANRPPTTSGVANMTIPTAPPTDVNLSTAFADADDATLSFAVSGNTDPALFTSTSITGSTLTLAPAGPTGMATLTVRATDPDGDFAETSFTVTVGATAPTVSATQINDGAQQRSRVTSIDITFSTQVTFAGAVADAFTLTRTGGGPVNLTATANIVGGVTVVTLDGFTGAETENGSLRDGRYTLTVVANQVSAGGQQMTGDYTFSDAQGLFRFYGDMNGDRRVDIADFGFFSLAYLAPANYDAALDFNADGRIDIADFGQFSVRYFAMLP